MHFDNLATAMKRAKHFAGIEYAGPFSVLARSGAAIAARNYSMLLDAEEGDLLGDLVLLDSWARSINQHCDAHQVSTDPVARDAFASFRSRMWMDPARL